MSNDGETRLDSHGNIVDMQGNIMVPCQVVDQYRAGMQHHQWQLHQRQTSRGSMARYSPLGNPSANFASAAVVSSSSPARSAPPARSAHFVASSPLDSTSGDTPSLAALHGAGGSSNTSSASHDASLTAAPRAQPQLVTTFAAQQSHPSIVGYAAGGWLPQEGHNLSADSAYPAAWLSAQQQQQHSGLDFGRPQDSPQRQTPTIRVTTDFTGVQAQHYLQPQDVVHSAASTSSSLPPDGQVYNTNPYHSGHLSPQVPPYMPDHDESMQTPVSPVSVHEPSMADPQLTRKRSHSVMSQQEHPLVSAHSRSGSMGSIAIPPGDEYSPKASRAFKRGDPPTNVEGKWICNFADECRELVFDRKCEWSKHMDKHDRPYRCPHPSCAKLQGFTYSGGLLRHEREVHGKHGGPKAQLMCPHEDCKRHNGKGFTRKENLNEHLRRVHSMKDSPSQNQHYLPRDGMDAIPGAEDAETPASGLSGGANVEELAAMSPALGKRKRSLLENDGRTGAPEGLDHFLDEENRRLRAELERRDQTILMQIEKIKHLEQVVEARELSQQQQQQLSQA